MHDRPKILGGLVIFVVLVLFPFWNNLLGGEPNLPELKVGTDAKRCVEPTNVMRATHMELLNRWRNAVVRQDRRTTEDGFGHTVTMSLTGTCLSCHTDKKAFCDSCHNAMAVAPTCWECHVEPQGRT
jgi:hypothetical protein